MSDGRDLDWAGCHNVRDLGGLATVDGRRTRFGAIVRADALDRLTAAGWSRAVAHGVGTVIDLRNAGERGRDVAPRPGSVTTVHVEMDDVDDREMWEHIRAGNLDGSPLYFPIFLEKKAARCAAVVSAVAQAAPGAVVIHCGAGRDRTGLTSLLLLGLAGVEPEEIAADYERSTARLTACWPAHGHPDQGRAIAAVLERRGTTARTLILELLAGLDVPAYLTVAGVAAEDLGRIRHRLLPAG